MKVRIRVFGVLREESGADEWDLVLPDEATVKELRQCAATAIPGLEALQDRVAVSIDFEIASDDRVLRDGEEVALLPPVSGGGGTCSLDASPLVESEVAARVAGPDAGGVVTFVGAVRDHARGHEIDHLEYEAYPEMALREMEKIALQTGERWPGTRLAMAHRTGRLEIGEAAVIIVAASAHRAAAFEACRYAIDTLKETVPIWKKEVTRDGQYWVDDRA